MKAIFLTILVLTVSIQLGSSIALGEDEVRNGKQEVFELQALLGNSIKRLFHIDNRIAERREKEIELPNISELINTNPHASQLGADLLLGGNKIEKCNRVLEETVKKIEDDLNETLKRDYKRQIARMGELSIEAQTVRDSILDLKITDDLKYVDSCNQDGKECQELRDKSKDLQGRIEKLERLLETQQVVLEDHYKYLVDKRVKGTLRQRVKACLKE